MQDSKEIVPVITIVKPIVSIPEALSSWKSYEELKMSIKTSTDIQLIQGKEFLKKSFWRKMSKFFGLSLELKSENNIKQEDNSHTWYAVYRAYARTGDFMDGDGACNTHEKGRILTTHDARATAHTRAKNRAISDLVGGGEVSAEEVINDSHEIMPEKKNSPATEKQIKMIYAKFREAKINTPKEMNDHLSKWVNSDLDHLQCDHVDIIINKLKTLTPKFGPTDDQIPF